LDELYKHLNAIKSPIYYQVLSYNNKIIGVVAEINNIKGFIPCFPSSMHNELDMKYMDDEDIWSDYKSTILFLTNINKANSEIPCKPVIKVLEDGLIVGVLTETNQFVKIIPPMDPANFINDGLQSIDGYDYINKDVVSLTSTNIDFDRILYVNRISLETSIYNAFRNTVKILLKNYENINIKKEIEEIINAEYLIYTKKLEKIMLIMKELTVDHVEFIDYTNDMIDNVSNVSACINNNKCDSKYCLVHTEGETCKLLIPRINLINDNNNNMLYYGRIADEFIRYNRISSFLLNDNVYLSFNKLEYNLKQTELIVLQSLLTQEYFDDLIVANKNKYATYTTFDTINPDIHPPYSNIIDFKKIQEHDKYTECSTKIFTLPNTLKPYFNTKIQELEFDNTYNCSFKILLIMLEKYNIRDVNQVKILLIDEYKNLLHQYNKNILDILHSQGKTIIVKQIYENKLLLENYIISDNFYITNLDILILAKKFNVPLVMYSSTKLKENNNKFLTLHQYTPETIPSQLYFIKTPVVKTNIMSKYRFLKDTKHYYVKVKDIKPTMIAILEGSYMDFDAYIADFIKPKKVRKKKIIIVSQDQMN
jgi:hypothetical protein